MSLEDPSSQEIDPALKRQALQEIEEWGAQLAERDTTQKLLDRHIEAARDVLKKPAPDELRKQAKYLIILDKFKDIGIKDETGRRIIEDIEKRLRH